MLEGEREREENTKAKRQSVDCEEDCRSMSEPLPRFRSEWLRDMRKCALRASV